MTEVEEVKKDIVATKERLEEELRTFFFHMVEHRAALEGIFQLEEWEEENINSQALEGMVGDIHNILYEIRSEADDLDLHGEDLESHRIDLEDAEGYAEEDAAGDAAPA